MKGTAHKIDKSIHDNTVIKKASLLVNEINHSGPLALVMGSEEDGIEEKLLRNSDVQFAIPMKGEIESLNVSVASAVAIYALNHN